MKRRPGRAVEPARPEGALRAEASMERADRCCQGQARGGQTRQRPRFGPVGGLTTAAWHRDGLSADGAERSICSPLVGSAWTGWTMGNGPNHDGPCPTDPRYDVRRWSLPRVAKHTAPCLVSPSRSGRRRLFGFWLLAQLRRAGPRRGCRLMKHQCRCRQPATTRAHKCHGHCRRAMAEPRDRPAGFMFSPWTCDAGRLKFPGASRAATRSTEGGGGGKINRNKGERDPDLEFVHVGCWF